MQLLSNDTEDSEDQLRKLWAAIPNVFPDLQFNLDFLYDADIDKIRKIIKKVGKSMLEHEEYGKDFIRPVKSQGIREITNSVMTIRVKFTAQPGTHFVIRCETYRLITEALNAKGIYYAHKKVIIDLSQPATTGQPDLSTEQKDPEVQAAGAAAQRIIEQEEAGTAVATRKRYSYDQARSKRSKFITLFQAATKSLINFTWESAVA